MGRFKTSGTEKMDKRRKKNTIRRVSTSSTSSSVITSLSPSLTPVTTITPPSHKNEECEQCGNTMTLNALPKKQQNCQVCEYVVYCKSQRPCVHCKAIECDYFCEWCGKGYHTKCARLCNENVLNSDGFCCSTCEMEQGEDNGTKEDGNTAACGACELPFQTLHDSNTKENEESIGFKVNQSVLVENDEVLYNATITHVDTTLERIKIHFLRWSKSFDHWYDMDDERINESLACDCCNQWFHIGCLPLIKSSGRFKDTTYVCPDCLDAAKGFYTGTNVRIPATKATKTITTSSSAVNRARKLSQVDEVPSTSPKGAIVKRRNGTKLVVVDSDSDDEVDISIRVEPTKKKDETKKTKEGSEKTCTDSIPNKSSSSKPSSLAAATNKKAIKGNKRKSSDLTDTKSTKKSLAVDDGNKIRTGKLSKKRNRSVSLDEATTDDNHSSPEHTLSVDPLSPSHASLETAAAITPPKDNHKPQTFHRRVRSGHSVSSILNSPLSPFGGSSSPSMSVVQDVSRPQSAPLTGRSFESHLVKVEEDPFFLPSLSKKSKTSTASDNPSTTLSEKSSISRGPLSAFDILREVATQSMSDDLNSSGSSAEIAFSNGTMSVDNVNSYVDVYFEVRKEMYLRICQLEEERCLDSNTAQLLRSMIYPTSNRFHDLQFVYVVNKELPSWQLTKRLLELVPVTAGGTAPVVVPRMPIFNSTFSRPSIAICSSHTIGSNATTPQSRTGSMSTIVPPLLNRSTGHATSESVYETSSPLPSS